MESESATSLPISFFTRHFCRLNHLPSLFAWRLLPGMQFGTPAIWWGNGRRPVVHEGIDLRYYSCGTDKLIPLSASAAVVPLWAGEVVAVSPDFLGSTIWIRHGPWAGGVLYSAWGHVRPAVTPGNPVAEDTPLGTMARPRRLRRVLPHFHLSFLLADSEIAPHLLHWPMVGACGRFCDPWPCLQEPMVSDWPVPAGKVPRNRADAHRFPR